MTQHLHLFPWSCFSVSFTSLSLSRPSFSGIQAMPHPFSRTSRNYIPIHVFPVLGGPLLKFLVQALELPLRRLAWTA